MRGAFFALLTDFLMMPASVQDAHSRGKYAGPSRSRTLRPPQQVRVALQVSLGATEPCRASQQAFEIVADSELVGDPHATVQLHCLLSDKSGGLADDHLRRREAGHTLGSIRRLAAGRGEVSHRAGLLHVDEHIGHAMPQRLQSCNRRTELHACPGVFGRQGQQPIESPECLRTERGGRIIEYRGQLLDDISANPRALIYLDTFQYDVGRTLAVAY